MKCGGTLLGMATLSVSVFASGQSPSSPAPAPDPQTALVRQYCAG